MIIEVLEQAKHDIKNGNPEVAAERLIEALDQKPNTIDPKYYEETRNLLVFTLGKYRILEKDKNKGTISRSEFTQEISQIVFSLLDQINSIKKISNEKIEIKPNEFSQSTHSQSVKKGSIEITIDEDLECFSVKELASLLKLVSQLSEKKSVIIKNIMKGSVKITLEASEEDIKVLYHLIKLGVLSYMKVSNVEIAPDEKIDKAIKTMPEKFAKIIKGINELQELKVIELDSQDKIKIKKKYKSTKKDKKVSEEKLDVYFQLQEEIAKNKKSETIAALYTLFAALSPFITLIGVVFLGKFLFNLVENLLSAESDDAEADVYKKIELFLRAVTQQAELRKLDLGDLQTIEHEMKTGNLESK
ncbi:MAG: hypothetical protein GC192_15335 [Bacteroidetes bacterium]|nr:hypothetical protein [Bacteroidota bacterium]